MPTVLLTGFEPFDGDTSNPSWTAVQEVRDRWDGDAEIQVRQLPVDFAKVDDALRAALAEVDPDVVISVGLAGGIETLEVERVAINVDDARIPDNKGQQPVDEPIVAGGPAAWFSTLPVKAMVAAMREAGVPASVSQTAGTFVCNHVMYGLLHKLSGIAEVKGGFIHIPYLPQQAAAHPGAPSMAAETVRLALEVAIATALQVDDDIAVTGGATH